MGIKHSKRLKYIQTGHLREQVETINLEIKGRVAIDRGYLGLQQMWTSSE